MKKLPILTATLLALLATAWVSLATVGARSESAGNESKQAAKANSADDSPKRQAKEKPVASQKGRPVDIAAGDILRDARKRMRGYRSVKANLVETVVIGGRKFRGTGTYLQGRDFRLKMSLEFQLGDEGKYRASMLQVCDGQVLWASHQHHHLSSKSSETDSAEGDSNIERRITRRDVREILREAALHDQVHLSLLSAELGMGGISELLSSLERSMAFGKVREEEIDGKPFLIFQGRWNLGILSNFLKEKELEELRSNSNTHKLPRLPEHVPDMVRLYFDRESLFPRRVLYLKRREKADALLPMLSLSFVDVVLNAPVDANDFNFVPPDKVYPQDVTSRYIQMIREAAKK